MKDKDMKLEDVKYPNILGGSPYILILYISSNKEVVSHLEVELYKPRIISLARIQEQKPNLSIVLLCIITEKTRSLERK